MTCVASALQQDALFHTSNRMASETEKLHSCPRSLPSALHIQPIIFSQTISRKRKRSEQMKLPEKSSFFEYQRWHTSTAEWKAITRSKFVRELLPDNVRGVTDSIEEEGRETMIKTLECHCNMEKPDWNTVDSLFFSLVRSSSCRNDIVVAAGEEASWKIHRR